MQKNFTHLLWTYQNYFSKAEAQVVSLNLIFDADKFFEDLFSRYEQSIPEIEQRLIDRILNQVC